jgi:hypothetical protein
MTMHRGTKHFTTLQTLRTYSRSLLTALLAVLLALGPVSPAFAQTPATQNPPANPAPPAATAQVQTPAIPPVTSLGLAKHDFTNGPRAFPTLLAPYRPISIESPDLINSPRLEQLVHDGKLQISLQDAVELALENNLDIHGLQTPASSKPKREASATALPAVVSPVPRQTWLRNPTTRSSTAPFRLMIARPR